MSLRYVLVQLISGTKRANSPGENIERLLEKDKRFVGARRLSGSGLWAIH